MPKKIEIFYDFIKEGEEKMEEHKLKSITGADVKRILELIDVEGIDIEVIIDGIKKLKGGKIKMTDQKTDDEKFSEEEKTVQEFMAKPENNDERFSKEIKIVEKYQEDHPGVSYRDAVLASLDRTEPVVKKEFTAEEIKEQEQLKNIENYLDANPRASYSDAVKILLKGEKPTLEEKLIEEYMSKNPESSYRDAVIEALSLLKKEPKKEE